MTSRAKREALDYIESTMKNVQNRVYNLSPNTTLIDEPPNLATNTISEMSAGCIIMDKGQVNCSNNIYRDRRTWKQSRHQIDNEIHQLKQKLEKLKEIRRHLKQTKPISSLEEIEDVQKNRTGRVEIPEINELSVPLEQETRVSTEQYYNATRNKKKRKRIHENDGPKIMKRPRLETTEENRVEPTTNAPVSRNHHRHNHGTTRGYLDGDFSTQFPTTKRKTTTTVTTTLKVIYYFIN